jgi:hypothetical protein
MAVLEFFVAVSLFTSASIFVAMVVAHFWPQPKD